MVWFYQVLQWNLSPMTAHLWLTTMYQVIANEKNAESGHNSEAESNNNKCHSSAQRRTIASSRSDSESESEEIDCRSSADIISWHADASGCRKSFLMTCFKPHDFLQIIRVITVLDIQITELFWQKFELRLTKHYVKPMQGKAVDK